jgi:acyl-CoA dehydrogenase
MFAPEHELFRATVRDFNRVAYDAVQIFGGYGYMREFPVERFYRDARLWTIGGGTSEIMKEISAKRRGF